MFMYIYIYIDIYIYVYIYINISLNATFTSLGGTLYLLFYLLVFCLFSWRLSGRCSSHPTETWANQSLCGIEILMQMVNLIRIDFYNGQ